MSIIEPAIEITDDGSATLRHPVFREAYHSLRGAAGESSHVFIGQGLAAIPGSDARILEIGFGSGLNAWLTLLYGVEHQLRIDYHAVELYPVAPETAGRLSYTEDPLFMSLHLCGWESPQIITGSFTLTKYETDLTVRGAGWEKFRYDLVYFDAFAPDTQPEMWSEEVFIRLHRLLVPGGLLVTYSAKGTVKQALRGAGFTVHRLPGAMGKHHMLRAVKS